MIDGVVTQKHYVSLECDGGELYYKSDENGTICTEDGPGGPRLVYCVIVEAVCDIVLLERRTILACAMWSMCSDVWEERTPLVIVEQTKEAAYSETVKIRKHMVDYTAGRENSNYRCHRPFAPSYLTNSGNACCL
jgi:hypothetical protein